MRERTDPSPALLELAASQGHVLTARQAGMHELTRSAQRRLLRLGAWQRLADGILLTHNGEPAWESWAWAGVLRAGDEARWPGGRPRSLPA